MKHIFITLICGSLLFGCRKNQAPTSGPNPGFTDTTDVLSDKTLALIDQAGVDANFSFEDALFADGSSMREWESQNDTGYTSAFTREHNISDKQNLFICNMTHRAVELIKKEVQSQPNGLAYVWGSKYTKDSHKDPAAACKDLLYGLDCAGMIYQMAIGSGLKFPSVEYDTHFFSKIETWNKAFDESEDFKGLKMTEHKQLPQSKIVSGDILVYAGGHIGMVVFDKIDQKLKFYHSAGGQKKSCAQNSLASRGPMVTNSFGWFFTTYPNYSILRVIREGVPGVTTMAYANQTHTSVEFAGVVTNDGESPVTARGICWSTHPESTLSDNFTVEGEGKGYFNSVIPDLLSYPYYYIRAYATNQHGTSYGLEAKLTPLPDSLYLDRRDGQEYTFRHIGNQVWMTKNLDYYIDSGDPNNPISCTYPGGGAEYGHLYTFAAANQAIPEGWFLPSDNDYFVLLDYLAAITKVSSIELDQVLKSQSSWDPTIASGSNVSGFSALAAGSRRPVKDEASTGLNHPLFGGLHFNTWWWKREEETDNTAHIIGINEQTITATSGGPKEAFFSVRCIRIY